MNGKVVGTPNQIRGAYQDFLHFFQIAIEDNNGFMFTPDPPLASWFLDSGTGTVLFKGCFYLKNLQSRRLKGGQRLDLVGVGLEELERNDPWRVKKSTVYLNYFTVTGDEARLAQSLHFDFDDKAQGGHPFFHLQLTDELIPDADRQSARFNLQVHASPEQQNECSVTTRIPTPDMTLTSVLYCLAADHLRADTFQKFAEQVEPIQNRLPVLRFEALKASVAKSPAHFKSCHWFAHAIKFE
jgi:hypothetical protein